MSNPTSTEYLNYAIQYVETNNGYPVHTKLERFIEVDEDAITGDPIHWMHYYVRCMAYFNTQVFLWKSVHETLDTHYENMFAKLVAESSKGITKAQYEARSQLAALREARSIAENNERKAMCDYHTVVNYRDVCSRSITMRENRR